MMEELHLPLKEVERWSHALYLFLQGHREITSAHSVDFFTYNHWDNIIKSSWKEELLSVSSEEQLVQPSTGGSPGSLGEFLQKASALRLPLLASKSVLTTHQAESDSILKFGMNAKKSHEVDIFSQHVDHLTTLGNITQVLDIGSGKGYLSQHLALHYGLTVVGVDAQEINTLGAEIRNRKVHKAWKSLEKKKYLTHEEHVCSKIPDSVAECFNEDGISVVVVDKDCTPSGAAVDGHGTSGAAVDEDCMLSGAAVDDLSQEDSHDSYCPLTWELKMNTFDELLKQVQKLSNGIFDPHKSFCITGLHTCGDLAVNVLRLFLQSPTARAMTVIGCCYHLVTESDGDGDVGMHVPGFPLSAYLKALGANLGRTTRMLSCQAISKISTTVSGSSLQLVFWRALLQVLLKRKFPELYATSSHDITVGRLRHKPADFLSYVKAAAARLRLDISNVTDTEILDILTEYQHEEINLKAFLQVKTVLAPCIETLLILDRLLFLQEKDDTLDVYLVGLFQPEISPRSVAIAARRQ